jgi:hypothetical protein
MTPGANESSPGPGELEGEICDVEPSHPMTSATNAQAATNSQQQVPSRTGRVREGDSEPSRPTTSATNAQATNDYLQALYRQHPSPTRQPSA